MPDYAWGGEFCFPWMQNVTREQSPYGYSPYFLLGSVESCKGATAEYSDRMESWDRDKYVRAKEAMGAARFPAASLSQLDKFVKVYFGEGFEAVGLGQGCNVANGYPYWIVFVKEVAA